VSIENPTMSSKVTGQTVCVSGHYELTSITLAPGTKSQGEIVKSAAHAAPFALVYGPSWVVAVTGEKMPHASAGRYSLADFAHTIAGPRGQQSTLRPNSADESVYDDRGERRRIAVGIRPKRCTDAYLVATTIPMTTKTMPPIR